MKTKKLLYIGCLMAASLVTFSSCGDFLDEDPKGQLTPEKFFLTEDDLTASVNALYERINQTQSWTNPMYPQWQGDDIKPIREEQTGKEVSSLAIINDLVIKLKQEYLEALTKYGCKYVPWSQKDSPETVELFKGLVA